MPGPQLSVPAEYMLQSPSSTPNSNQAERSRGRTKATQNPSRILNTGRTIFSIPTRATAQLSRRGGADRVTPIVRSAVELGERTVTSNISPGLAFEIYSPYAASPVNGRPFTAVMTSSL